MSCRRWTSSELAYLKTWYHRLPIERISKKLGRSIPAIRNRAFRIGITSDVPAGYVPLVWVDPRPDMPGARETAIAAARRDGVLERFGTRFAAPEAWADEYAERLGEQAEAERRTRSWLTTREVASLVGMSRGAVLDGICRGHGLGRRLAENVEHVKVARPFTHYKWNPRQAEQIVRAHRAEQERA